VAEPFTLREDQLRENVALIDTSAVVSILDRRDSLHRLFTSFFENAPLDWAALNLTAHETFTRVRYRADVHLGLRGFDLLRSTGVTVIDFEERDETRARALLVKYADHRISHHDAICAAVMRRTGIYKIFTQDSDFQILGFQVLPNIF